MSVTEDPASILPPTSSGSWLVMGIATVAIAAAILSIFLRSGEVGVPYGYDGESRIGQTFPKLEVDGWINGPGPTSRDLNGQLVVVDVWAFWCGPCRAIAPDLVKLHELYTPRGVKFVGLTSENAGVLPESQRFIRDEGITWPQGYGADGTLDPLQVDAIPEVWIIGRDGKIAWDMNEKLPIRDALDKLLSGK